ncbi:MAG: DUF5606 domain-containing protein [Bacteroidales bacterium]|nr:DUF5606 domain-containing protein [Bacteroidales bacterium]
MDLSNILVVSGKPDLYELLSHTKGGAIVESLADKRRMPVFKNDRISSLNEISIFTEEGDKPLREIFQDIYKKEGQQPISFDIRKSESAVLFDYFRSILPNYDTERVHASDVKKVLNWYNLLLQAGKIDLETPEAEGQEASPEA